MAGKNTTIFNRACIWNRKKEKSFMKEFQTFQIAHFTNRTEYSNLQYPVIKQLKKHLLDSLGSLIYSTDRPTILKLIRQIKSMGESGRCKVPVIGSTAPDRAAQLYTALIRYPDFMDNFLGKESTCHPCDNIGALLAAGQLINCSGKDFLLSMALGYEIECRLVEEFPAMIKGFDHTLLLGFSLTAALAKMLSLTEDETANALAISGCMYNPLVTCRASYTYEWKGFASSAIAMGCLNNVLLAKEGMTGPVALFEGPKGYKDVMDMSLKYNWENEDFSLIKKCVLKIFNAEVHTQPTLEAVMDLKNQHEFSTGNIESVEITTFLTAYHIVGNGAYGDRKEVFSKEQADHSLPYTVAVTLLDGEVHPQQLLPDRINKHDVQELMQKINIKTSSPLHKPVLLAGILDPYTEAYPEKLCTKVCILFKDGKKK